MENSNNKKIIIWAVVLVLAALVIAWWVTQEGVINNDNLAAVGGLDAGAASTTSVASLKVDDQFPGGSVFISDVQLTKGGWVVIKKDVAGRPDDIVGVGYFDSTVKVGEVTVPVTTEGEKYFATLYNDNGDSRFSLTNDTPVLGIDGQPVMINFTITSNLPEVKG